MANDYVVISVQSQKGGVGKTTVALNLAQVLLESKKYEVLFFDLDIAGTDATYAAKSDFWQNWSTPVEFKIEKDEADKSDKDKTKYHSITNLVDLFDFYMRGEEIPAPYWGEKEKANKIAHIISEERSGAELRPGKINIVGSSLAIGKQSACCKRPHFSYGPSVLFEEAQADWFIDMIRSLIAKASKMPAKKRLAVVIDTSPGYSGLAPKIEDWLTDLGPKRAKFLIVSSLDIQDNKACIQATERLKRLLDSKWKAAMAFQNLVDKESTSISVDSDEGKRFFARLASTYDCPPIKEGDSYISDASSNLSYFHAPDVKSGKIYVDNPEKWWGILYNRVPIQIIDGLYRYRWNQVSDKSLDPESEERVAADLCIKNYAKSRVPYVDEFAFQFVSSKINNQSSGRLGFVDLSIETNLHDKYEDELKGLRDDVLKYPIVELALKLTEQICRNEETYRCEIDATVQRKNLRRDNDFCVDWVRFAPSWRFTDAVRLNPPGFTSMKRLDVRRLSGQCDLAKSIVLNQLRTDCDELESWIVSLPDKILSSKVSHSLPRYVAASLLSASAAKAAFSFSKISVKSRVTSDVEKIKLLIVMALLVEQINADASQETSKEMNARYWLTFSVDESIHKKAEVLLRSQYRSFLTGRHFRARQPTLEYLKFCRSQLALWNVSDDIRLIRRALFLTKTPTCSGTTTALVSKVLEETLIIPKLSVDKAMYYLGTALGGSDSRKDPLSSLLEMERMQEFERVLRPMVGDGRWDLV